MAYCVVYWHGQGWLGHTHVLFYTFTFSTTRSTHTFCTHHDYKKQPSALPRNIPAVAWVLRPKVRPAARSARMIDMVLLGLLRLGRCVLMF